MDIADYLYVDRGRMDSYFEQIGGPVKYDKVPVWKVALGLTGPSAEGTQERVGRPFTEHEKLSKLATVLPKTGSDEALFRLVSAWGVRVTLSVDNGPIKQIAFWMCRKDVTERHTLFLIEDSRSKDEPVRLFTGFSAFGALLGEYNGLPNNRTLVADKQVSREVCEAISASNQVGMETKLHELLRSVGIPTADNLKLGPFSNGDSNKNFQVRSGEYFYKVSLMLNEAAGLFNLNVQEDNVAKYSANPILILQQAGFNAASERKIDALYRARLRTLDGTVAYPIFVASNPSPYSSLAN